MRERSSKETIAEHLTPYCFYKYILKYDKTHLSTIFRSKLTTFLQNDWPVFITLTKDQNKN